jgi:hypothetical protein
MNSNIQIRLKELLQKKQLIKLANMLDESNDIRFQTSLVPKTYLKEISEVRLKNNFALKVKVEGLKEFVEEIKICKFDDIRINVIARRENVYIIYTDDEITKIIGVIYNGIGC